MLDIKTLSPKPVKAAAMNYFSFIQTTDLSAIEFYSLCDSPTPLAYVQFFKFTG